MNSAKTVQHIMYGESVPVTKAPPPYSSVNYDVELHKRHTLFCGTEVLQTRFYNREVAVVVRVGYLTTKGELVRSILFPKPMGFKFYADSMKFVLLLFAAAVAGMSFSVYLYMSRHADLETILLRTLDIVTIVVPPALPAAMTAGTVYSQNRLSKLGIFCISPPRINVCGKVKLVAFDKTGTLTEDGLDFSAVIPAVNGTFSEVVKDASRLHVRAPIVAAMACCHSLTRIDGELKGDPLDLSMFLATQWVLEEPGPDTSRYDTLSPTVVRPLAVKPLDSDDLDKLTLIGGLLEMPYEIGIVRQFPFISSAQCMSVITRDLGSPFMRVFCKGAPEKVIGMCLESSVPTDFHQMLTHYTSTGYRVLALAYRNLEPSVTWRHAQRVKREQIEVDMFFAGLLVMQNTLKPETTPVIKQLQKASIRCLMVTAVSVARDCGMIPNGDTVVNLKLVTAESNSVDQVDYEILGSITESENANHQQTQVSCDWHYAVDGRTWTHIHNTFPELIPQIVAKGTVFARMSPDQKTQLIEALQDLDYVVAMVGDGANDCGALKTAHVGVSLSEAEASVAAPFTSRSANIECIVHLLCEGRCALVTSFGVFKYMALYSLIQFISVLILYKHGSILGNMQFLYIDLVITTILAVVMGRTEPSPSLVVQRPLGSLLAPSNMFPLFLQLALVQTIGPKR
ncbi:Calcium-transporting ATPase sarcoplasmic/endoplasmic reticulum type [Gryllus bimaculatus]|nr:Calcium-transporting ATPase sarcoplasmic/endoplasmic reticulum type [Gryllus bimaculatus]